LNSAHDPREPHGYRAADRAPAGAGKQMWGLEDKIMATPAHTPAGMAAKARIAFNEAETASDEPAARRMIQSLARD
jgi:hypothetical protein